MNLVLPDKIYDIFKFIAQVLLPALATLYFALSQVWGLPFSEEVVGTIVAADAFLGALLGVSTNQYNKHNHADGYMLFEDGEDPSVSELVFTKGYDQLVEKNKLVIDVRK